MQSARTMHSREKTGFYMHSAAWLKFGGRTLPRKAHPGQLVELNIDQKLSINFFMVSKLNRFLCASFILMLESLFRLSKRGET